MYLVLNFLEVIGVVQHTKTMSEYRLTLDRAPIVDYAMNKRKQACLHPHANSLDNLLNRYGPNFFRQLYDGRCEVFWSLTERPG
jgi:hypothetical protein